MNPGRFLLNKTNRTSANLLSMASSTPNVVRYARAGNHVSGFVRIFTVVLRVSGSLMATSTVDLTSSRSSSATTGRTLTAAFASGSFSSLVDLDDESDFSAWSKGIWCPSLMASAAAGSVWRSDHFPAGWSCP